jgi:hypothetical protein
MNTLIYSSHKYSLYKSICRFVLQMVGHIDISILPFPVISAGSILCLCFYNRLTVLVERLRKFDRELIEQYKNQAEHHDRGSSIIIRMAEGLNRDS